MFGDKQQAGVYLTPPMLVTNSANQPVPQGANRLFVFLVAAGGSGAAYSNVSPTACGGGQGAFGGVVFDWDRITDFIAHNPSSISLTIAGQTSGVSAVAGNAAGGNTGNNTELSIGGLKLRAKGGSGGGTATVSPPGGDFMFVDAGGTQNTIRTNEALALPFGQCVPLLPSFVSQQSQSGLMYGVSASQISQTSSGVNSAGMMAHAASGGAYNGAAGLNAALLLPWWVLQAGLVIGSAGSNVGSVAGPGAPSFSGAGSSGVTSVGGTSADATGFGGGSGGVACTSGAATSGKGAPGCAVVMWEIKR